MKAIATCPVCGKKLTTDCKGCITGKADVHKCKGMKEPDVVENIDWKIISNEPEEEDNDFGFEDHGDY